MGFRLGNLKLNEVVSRLGIQLSYEDSKWFKERRVDKVSDQFNNNYEIPKNTCISYFETAKISYLGRQKREPI